VYLKQRLSLRVFGIVFGKEDQNFEGPQASGGIVAPQVLDHLCNVGLQGLQAKDLFDFLDVFTKDRQPEVNGLKNIMVQRVAFKGRQAKMGILPGYGSMGLLVLNLHKEPVGTP